MAKNDKTWQRIMGTPVKVDITFSELESFLIKRGFKKEMGKGDHVKFSHPDLQSHLSIPCGGKTVKPIYIRNIQKAIHILNIDE